MSEWASECAEVSATMALCKRNEHTCILRTNTINVWEIESTDRRKGTSGMERKSDKRENGVPSRCGCIWNFQIFPSYMHAFTVWRNNIKSFNIYFSSLVCSLSLSLAHKLSPALCKVDVCAQTHFVSSLTPLCLILLFFFSLSFSSRSQAVVRSLSHWLCSFYFARIFCFRAHFSAPFYFLLLGA